MNSNPESDLRKVEQEPGCETLALFTVSMCFEGPEMLLKEDCLPGTWGTLGSISSTKSKMDEGGGIAA